MTCPSELNLSLPGVLQNCESILTPSLLGVRNPSCTGLIDIDLLDSRNVPLPGIVDSTGARRVRLTEQHIGKRLQVKVTLRSSGLNCRIYLTVQDNVSPTISCRDTVVSEIDSELPVTEGGRVSLARATDCSAIQLVYTDSIANYSCAGMPGGSGTGSLIAKAIYRRWLATDISGNSSTCIQEIKKARLQSSDIQAPRDTILDCETQPDLSKEYGLLRIQGGEGQAVQLLSPINGYLGNVYWNYSDETFAGQAGAVQLLRSWRIYDACQPTQAGVNPRTLVQRISVVDRRAPVINTPSDTLFASINQYDCTASVDLPPLSVSDNCDPATQVSVRLNNRLVQANGGSFTGLALGIHSATYTARDAVGNSAVATVTVKVKDITPPTLLVQPSRTFSLGGDGKATITPQGYDSGTVDDCGVFSLEIRRLGEQVWLDRIILACESVGASTQLEILATDDFGNAVSTIVRANIRDLLSPQVLAPQPQTRDCAINSLPLSQFGLPTISDNCGFTTRDSLIVNRDACGRGYLLRFWTVTDIAGNSTKASQRVDFTGTSSFGESNIIWPQHTIVSCFSEADTSSLDAAFAKPRFSSPPCSRISVGYTDQIFSTPGQGCPQIVRNWLIIDACANQSQGGGEWRYAQQIVIDDSASPNITAPGADLLLYTSLADCSGAELSFSSWQAADCERPIPFAIAWQSLDGSSSSLPAKLAHASKHFGLGEHSIVVTAVDACGNAAQRSFKLHVIDTLSPIARCQPSIGVALQAEATPLNPLRLDAGSSVICGQGFTFSTDFIPSCDKLGGNIARLLVRADNGREASCWTAVEVIDSFRYCPADKVKLAGRIVGNSGEGLQTRFTVSSAEGVNLGVYNTDASGNFAFSVNTKAAISITPFSASDPKRGITSYDLFLIGRHILGIKPLAPGPPQWAADGNLSATISAYDITLFRRLLLDLDQQLPSGQSYRFVARLEDGSLHPRASATSSFAPSHDVYLPKWLAVKLGDVSGASNFQSGGDLANRNASSQELSLSLVPGRVKSQYALVTDQACRLAGATLKLEGKILRLSPKLETHGLFHNTSSQGLISFYHPSGGIDLAIGDTLIWLQRPLKVEGQKIIGDFVQLDDDGEASAAHIRLLNSDNSEFILVEEVRVSPNPVKQGASISVLSPSEASRIRSIRVLDVRGSILNLAVTAESGEAITSLTQNLASGVYTLWIEFESGRINLQRLVIVSR